MSSLSYVLIGIIIILLLIILALFGALRKYRAAEKAAFETSDDETVSDMLKAYYAGMRTVYAQIRAWRHDYHNHQQVMDGLIEMERYDELKEYLHEYRTDSLEISEPLFTGNLMLDALIGAKMTKARIREISFEPDIKLPAKLPIQDSQMSSLVGNLLDNAIEACELIPDPKSRFIHLTIQAVGESLLIKTENSTDGQIRMQNGLYRTRKNSGAHGWGLISIDKISRKHGGQTTRFHDDQTFVSETYIPLRRDDPA